MFYNILMSNEYRNEQDIRNNTKINELIHGCESPKEFIKHIILIARKKPFLFLSELELKLNFTINPFIKFKTSISIESMSKKLKLEHISLDNNFFIVCVPGTAREMD